MSAAETQPARTVLAWQRTGLGVLAVAGLLLRSAAVHGRPAVLALAAVVAASGLVVLGVLTRRRAGSAQRAAGRAGDARAPRLAAVATGLVVLCAVCALAADLVVRTG
ncbi:hypothetical protein GCU67_11310 [Modestobacter muralis]|uniref:DUF202 domain-containing protein n=1 Tax=Modestobacter muralis TaxID=1608614 RepID=A0A6P0H7D3_9ACTN|nr:hypothetical protein [Modestobacter muralis]NEN51641.1 hypothetical protein [Modestobacter muralis]